MELARHARLPIGIGTSNKFSIKEVEKIARVAIAPFAGEIKIAKIQSGKTPRKRKKMNKKILGYNICHYLIESV